MLELTLKKHIGKDPCVVGDSYDICDIFTDSQREILATPSYTITEEKKAGLVVWIPTRKFLSLLCSILCTHPLRLVLHSLRLINKFILMHSKAIPGLGDIQKDHKEMYYCSSPSAIGQAPVMAGSASLTQSPVFEYLDAPQSSSSAQQELCTSPTDSHLL